MPQYSYAVGDTVQVSYKGRPYAGKVVAVLRDKSVRVAITVDGRTEQVNRLVAELKPLHVEPAR